MGVADRGGMIDESEFLGARDQLDPDVFVVRGGALESTERERVETSDTLGDRAGLL